MKAKTRQYGNEVLKLVKKNLPKIYNQFIKGKVAKLIDENKPAKAKFLGEGKKVGRVSKDLQLLWALGQMFHQLGNSSVILNRRGVKGPQEACMLATQFAWRTLSVTCCMLLWHAICNKGRKNSFLCINHDWSITQEAFADIPPDKIEGIKRSGSDRLLFSIETQIGIIMMAEYTSSCVKTLEKKHRALLEAIAIDKFKK